MRFMNEFDLHSTYSFYSKGHTPNRLALVMVVNNLRKWADNHSDGWAYWPLPVRAASKAIELIDGYTNEDITEAEMQKAVRPIKAFLTRQKVTTKDRELIIRAINLK